MASELSAADLQELTDLARKLAHFNLDEHLIEIVFQIWGPQHRKLLEDFNSIKLWTTSDMCAWIRSLSFLKQDVTTVLNTLQRECIDGEFLSTMDQDSWVKKLGLNYRHYLLIEFIFHGWAYGSKTLRLPADLRKLGVLTGMEADLSHLDPHTKAALTEADNDCAETGAGEVYGQLVVLGYKEYRSVDNAVTPLGLTNEKYVLRRRRIPNGLRALPPVPEHHFVPIQCSSKYTMTLSLGDEASSPDASAAAGTGGVSACTSEVTHFIPDPRYDMHQLGRALHSTNDFVIPGLVHEEIDGVVKGPVSRHACRIVSERLPPYRSFLLAGGFDTDKCLAPSKVTQSSISQGSSSPSGTSLDGFTTFGVKLWQPEMDQWLEVSVRGHTYLPRTHHSAIPSERIVTPLANQLTNGTILDLGGVSVLFQSPVQMASTKHVNPLSVVDFLNSLRPHCPVLMNDLRFLHLDPKQRTLRAIRGESESFADLLSTSSYSGGGSQRGGRGSAGFSSGRVGGGSGSFRIPLTDYSDLAEEARTYVFPACGHVHGYHRSMEGKPCPLCRRVGPFVPIALPFEPALCDASRPTHVFNPCGHVASRATCHYWSTKVKLFSRQQPTTSYNPRPACPFCAVDLVLCDETSTWVEGVNRRNGGNGGGGGGGLYYSRLILQTSVETAGGDAGADINAVSAASAGQLWSEEPSLQEAEQQRNELQLASHREEEVRRSQRVLHQREVEELRLRAGGGGSLPESEGGTETVMVERRRFPKYLG